MDPEVKYPNYPPKNATHHCPSLQAFYLKCSVTGWWYIYKPSAGTWERIRSVDPSSRVFPIEWPTPPKRKLTGGSSNYYKVPIEVPTTPEKDPYEAECNDIIEALDMRFAEANIFKAIWRRAAARLGNGKPGTSDLYDAEKIEFFGNRVLAQAQHQDGDTE